MGLREAVPFALLEQRGENLCALDVVGVIALQACGGLISAAVLKFADNILKNFATSVSTVLCAVLSVWLFGFRPTKAFMVGAYLVLATGYAAAGIILLGLASGRCGWLMHEAGHYSLTGEISVDRALQELIYGVGCGMSGAWWRNQHKKHHATPQKLQHDVDLDTLPLVAFHAKIAARARSPLVKLWLRLQCYLFIPVSCLLVALGWQLYLHPRHALRTKRKRELACMALRYVLLFGVVLRGMDHPVWAYLAYNQVAASYIFTNFSLSHTHLPVTEADEFVHWVEYAAKHTTNISPSPLCNWWMANLNFQVEHHLFPAMPQFQHKHISPRVRAFFEAHGLVYDVRPYFSCLRQTLANLHAVGHSTKDD